MKKLTKTLSLVLVVAMVLGLCVIGAGATFTDNDKVTADYSEAITIATDLKVVGGYTDGSFKPAGTLTRAEACVIMANMTLGTSAAAALAPTTVTFKDVPTSFWGYKYVEYCYQSGYIAGTGAGNFSPNSTLTGYQWALMLMRVLGYDLTSLSTGNWQINTAKVYYAADTQFSKVAISGAAVTREAATQMAYDALFKSTNATSGYALKYDGSAIGYYSTYEEAISAKALYSSLNSDNATKYSVDSETSTINPGTSLASTVFKVTKSTGKSDDFGRPSTIYKASTLAVGKSYGWNAQTKTFANVPTVSYTTSVTPAKIFADLGLTANVTATTYTDGIANASTQAIKYTDTTTLLGGNGCLTEVYYNSTTGGVTIVYVNTYFGQITTVTAATTVAKRTVTVTGAGVAGVAATPATGTYTTDSFALKDYVLYTVAMTDSTPTYVIESVAAATPITLTATSHSTTSFVAGGTTYKYSAKYVQADKLGDFVAHAVFVDSYGYVISVADADISANMAVVIKALDSTTLGGTAHNVRLLMADGTTKDVVATKAAAIGDGAATSTTAGDYVEGSIVLYSVNASGNYILTNAGDVACGANTAEIATGTVGFTAAGSSYKANSKTAFFVVTYDSNSVPTYKVYTGISSAPTITSATSSDVYVKAGNTYATAVFVDAAHVTSATTSKDVIYVTTKGAVTTTDATLGTYVTYNAVVNGEVTTIKASDGLFTADCICTAVTKNANGIITGKTVMQDTSAGVTPAIVYSDATAATVATGTTAEYNGIVVLNTAKNGSAAAATELTYADSSTVYYIAADGTISASTISGIKTDANDTAVYYTTNGVLTSAFITSVAD